MTTAETLEQIFRMVFDDDSIEIRPDLTANDVDGWDSLSHVNLITTVEAKFGIRFTQKELLKQRNVGDLLTDIDRKLAEK
ncbi:acyl carrier protein [Geomonas silvestris]|uniref:Acyl carrier protein n=1 Tax=Geomonas silvestris TaxID=2740184 RepID=A0A6V8MLR5_9BACT|nr:acyl carrier protein [Geomonas silvestris]GFO60970.1 acyl carrier protein [Geomonas silvestris]